jgi:hypothetical protein
VTIANHYNRHVNSITIVYSKMCPSLYYKATLIIQVKVDPLSTYRERTAMIPGFLLDLREGLEAALMVGIVPRATSALVSPKATWTAF